ncbi:hypothetical protein N7474_006642 [Penicillium riverlandense]|uniref:uncharacterized protein n=1 Tax=Penicillium riverlandense TaxID=1903569 RepID=UPI002548874C|nr:uncharacterized protein N7474_006642 [Penicillium riverlandense]KAJ5814865.1 hypothetical protein N7474_006642 [Penicillium riverlandense]
MPPSSSTVPGFGGASTMNSGSNNPQQPLVAPLPRWAAELIQRMDVTNHLLQQTNIQLYNIHRRLAGFEAKHERITTALELLVPTMPLEYFDALLQDDSAKDPAQRTV